jgi:uncharacterized protein
MARKRPQRTCIACRQTGEKRALIRLVRTPEGRVLVDETGKRSGRGAYLCDDPACWQIALKERRIGRALKVTPLPEDLARLNEYAQQLEAKHAYAKETGQT